MRVNSRDSVRTANSVHERFGSWEKAKASSDFKDGKYVIRNEPASVTSKSASGSAQPNVSGKR